MLAVALLYIARIFIFNYFGDQEAYFSMKNNENKD